MAGRNFREKKQQQSRVFRRYFLCLHSRGKQRKSHSEWLKTKEEKFVEKKMKMKMKMTMKMTDPSGQQGENERQWKNKSEHAHKKQNFW